MTPLSFSGSAKIWRHPPLLSPCFFSCARACVLSHVQLFATPWTVAPQASLSLGFSRQEYWSRLPLPPLGDLPNPGIETCLSYVSCVGRRVLYHYLRSFRLHWGFRTLLWVPWEAVWFCTVNCNLLICIRVWMCISYFLPQIIIKPDILISSSSLMNKNFVLINNYKQMQSWKQHSLCAKQEL